MLEELLNSLVSRDGQYLAIQATDSATGARHSATWFPGHVSVQTRQGIPHVFIGAEPPTMSHENYITEFLHPYGALQVDIRWMRPNRPGPHTETYFTLLLRGELARIGRGPEFELESDEFRNFFENYTRNLVPNPPTLVPMQLMFPQLLYPM